MLGAFNHIWKAIENLSEHHKKVCHEFALKHNCVRESYHGKTFEGNECAKLMTKIHSEKELCLHNLSDIESHIEIIKKLIL